MIRFKQRGDFKKVTRWLERVKQVIHKGLLDKYGKMGVAALSFATPVDTGTTAASWYYKIRNEEGKAAIEFHNSNINDNIPIAVIIQYGHGTGTGGWVEGRDYINPAMRPVFDKIVRDICEEVKKV